VVALTVERRWDLAALAVWLWHEPSERLRSKKRPTSDKARPLIDRGIRDQQLHKPVRAARFARGGRSR
jgi:hypothetical protein